MTAKILLSGKPKTGKSTLMNAILRRPVSPTDALEATATAIYVSGGGTGAADEAIKVHRANGHAIEPREALVERYTGRDIDEDVTRIDIQTDADFLADSVLIDTPGTNSSGGDFSQRHDTIAFAALEDADVRIHMTSDPSELRRLHTKLHQPLVIVAGQMDRKVDMASPTPWASVEQHRSRLKQVAEDMNLDCHFCAPLIGLSAELLLDEHFERVLALAGASSEQAFHRLLSPRECLVSEFSDVPLSLRERLSLVGAMSERLLLSPGKSETGAWPVLRFALFLARTYEIQKIDALREKLSEFSGVPQLRERIRADLGEVPRLRVYRVLLDAITREIEKTGQKLSSIRQKVAALADALANAEGAVCEITATAAPVLELLRASERDESERLLRYEKALTYLQSPSPLADGSARRVLQWLFENDCRIPFSVRQRAIEVMTK